MSARRIPPSVAFVTHSYPPALDGSAVLSRRLATGLAALGHRVHVVTTDSDDPGGFRSSRHRVAAPAVAVEDGVSVQRLPSAWRLSAAARLPAGAMHRVSPPLAEPLGNLHLGPVLRGLKKTLGAIAPDLIYATAFPFLHMHQATSIGNRLGTPVILQGSMHPEDAWSFGRRSIRRTIGRSTIYCANTQYEADYVKAWGIPENRVRVVGVGVDLRTSEPPVRRESPATILYFGHIAERKGVDVLIDAVPTIQKHHPSARFVIAGKSTGDTAQLRDRAARTPGADTVEWVTDVSEDAKWNLLRDASVLVYPSRAESFGIVFLEGWSAAVPVIGCHTGAVADVIDNGRTGFVVPPDNPAALAAAVCDLLADPARATEMGRDGWHHVQRHFTWDATVERVQAAVIEAVSAGAGRPSRPV